MRPAARLTLSALLLATLAACGAPAPQDKASAREKGRDTDETVFDDMVQTQDRARAVEDVTRGREAEWIADAERALQAGRETPVLAAVESRRLLASLHDPSRLGHEGEWLLVLREEDHAAALAALTAAFRLTAREAEVLYWVSKGKTNKDIGDILGTSPRTVNKHLEHVFEKLGVETRTAAANLAMGRMGARGGQD